MRSFKVTLVAITIATLSACASLDSRGGADLAAIEAALASPNRLPGDSAQDARRKASVVLAQIRLRPGMRVLDAFSAGGYYSELMARVVGPTGEVIAYNNPGYAGFAAKGIALRYADGRLPNVRQITTPIETLQLDAASLDAVIFIMSYHDLYWRPADGSWAPTDPNLLLRKLVAALRPGGLILVQDHVANAGGDTATVVDKLHRIDPAIVRRDFEAAGLRYAGSSNALAHPEDDHTKLVFDPAIQGRTDQFIYLFRKPARN